MLLEFYFRTETIDHFVMVTHQTAWLSIGGANNIFAFYRLLEVLACMIDSCRQIRTYGFESLNVELPLKSVKTQPGSLMHNDEKKNGKYF